MKRVHVSAVILQIVSTPVQRERFWERERANPKCFEVVSQPPRRDGEVTRSWSKLLRWDEPEKGTSPLQKAQAVGELRRLDGPAGKPCCIAACPENKICHEKEAKNPQRGSSPSFRAPVSLGPSQGYLGTVEVLSTCCAPPSLLSRYSHRCRWMPIFRGGEAAPTEGRFGAIPENPCRTRELHPRSRTNRSQVHSATNTTSPGTGPSIGIRRHFTGPLQSLY